MIVAFHGTQNQKKPLANLLIGESGSNEAEDFQLALAQWFEKGLGRGRRRVVFALLLLCLICSQQFSGIVWHSPKSHHFGQEGSHRETFVEKETDETSRLGHRQRVYEQVHRLILFAMSASRDRLENPHLELFILPPLRLHLLIPCREHRQG